MKIITIPLFVLIAFISIPAQSHAECCGSVELLPGEECCDGQPVPAGTCCNGKPLQAGQECCKKVSPETPYDPQLKCCETKGILAKGPPISSLDACPDREAPPNYTPTVNGCSNPVPGFSGWNAFFLSACNLHDTCYGTCYNPNKNIGLPRNTCDSHLRLDMRALCWSAYSNDKDALDGCYAVVDLYRNWVYGLGGSLYTAAQKEGCQCCQ